MPERLRKSWVYWVCWCQTGADALQRTQSHFLCKRRSEKVLSLRKLLILKIELIENLSHQHFSLRLAHLHRLTALRCVAWGWHCSPLPTDEVSCKTCLFAAKQRRRKVLKYKSSTTEGEDELLKCAAWAYFVTAGNQCLCWGSGFSSTLVPC